jgi:hypothetical protein
MCAYVHVDAYTIYLFLHDVAGLLSAAISRAHTADALTSSCSTRNTDIHHTAIALEVHLNIGTCKHQKEIEEFCAEDGGPSVLLVSLKAGGTGLNLARANLVYLLDLWCVSFLRGASLCGAIACAHAGARVRKPCSSPLSCVTWSRDGLLMLRGVVNGPFVRGRWNAGAEDQAQDRVWRIGQTRPVRVVRLPSRGFAAELSALRLGCSRHTIEPLSVRACMRVCSYLAAVCLH